MFTEHPIRAAAGRARLDRADALYLADSPRAGFRAEARGAAFALTPGAELIDAFAAWARPLVGGDPLIEDGPLVGGDPLVGALFRLSGGERDDGALLMDGIKLMETGAPEPALAAYERRVRQRAAVCLREKTGGGLLWVCAACLRIAREGLTKQ